MIYLGNITWGTGPVIPMTFQYEKRRSGSDMQYRVKVLVSPITGQSMFGYPIYLKLTFDGKLFTTIPVKEASPNRWSGAIEKTSGWCTVSSKTSGTTHLVLNVYSGLGSSRNETYNHYLPVDPVGGSTFTAFSGDLGSPQTITITPANSTYKHKMLCICGAQTVLPDGSTDGFFTGTTVTVTAPLSFASANVTSTVVPVTFRLLTYSSDGGALVGTTERIVNYFMPESIKPDCLLMVTDPTGYADTYGGYVQGQSKMDIEVSATLAYGSAIQSKRISADGKQYTKNCITGVIQSAENFSVVASVTDGRGRNSGDAVFDIEVLPYSAPKITKLTVTRCDEDGTDNPMGQYAMLVCSFEMSELNKVNYPEVYMQYKKTSETEYTTEMLASGELYSLEDGYVIFPADDASSYDVILWLYDDFHYDGISRATTLSTAAALMHIRADGTGIAFGKLSSGANRFEFGKDVYDKYGTLMGAGLAAYTGAGDAYAINPNTTLEELCLTNHSNGPQGAGVFYYIYTAFYTEKTASASRMQFALPYSKTGSMYHRYYYYKDAKWSAWTRYMNASEVYPVGSVCIRYDTTNPGTLFGGTWTRIEGRMLFGCASSGTVGATGSHTTGSGSSSLPYVNVAVWRRTA